MLFSISSIFSQKQKILNVNFDPREGNVCIRYRFLSQPKQIITLNSYSTGLFWFFFYFFKIKVVVYFEHTFKI